jgi:hypothetical protein
MVDADLFPSLPGGFSLFSVFAYSSGYSNVYLHKPCNYRFASQVLTCASRINNGVCTQRVLFVGGDFKAPKIEDQICASKIGRGVSNVYPRGSNPHSEDACVGSVENYSFWDDGPSIPLLGRILSDLILGILASETSLVFWHGGVIHDWCYHNTIDIDYFNKDKCDTAALNTWIQDCENDNKGTGKKSTLEQIIDKMFEVLDYTFPLALLLRVILKDITCEGLSYAYYAVLAKTDVGIPAYFATNSRVTLSSQYYSLPYAAMPMSSQYYSALYVVSDTRIRTIVNVLMDNVQVLPGNVTVFDPDIIAAKLYGNNTFSTSSPSYTSSPFVTNLPSVNSPPFAQVPPTGKPVSYLTNKPTHMPTRKPTKKPIKMPTRKPTKKPTKMPTRKPTKKPTKKPTHKPTKELARKANHH